MRQVRANMTENKREKNAMQIPEYTTATALVCEAIRGYKKAHRIPLWEDDRIEIVEPTDPEWEEWQRGGSRMEGDPHRSEVALRCDGYGAYYGCVEAAIADLPRYFLTEEYS